MKKTIVVEARVDARDLATCAAYLISIDNPPTSRSDMVWKCIRILSQSVDTKHHFETTEEAYGFLSSLGLGDMNRNRRNLVTLSRVVAGERRMEGQGQKDLDEETRDVILRTLRQMESQDAMKPFAQKLSIDDDGEEEVKL